MYNEKEFGSKYGAIVATTNYTPPAGYHIYEVVPDPNVTIKAIPIDTSLPYVSSTRLVGGVAVTVYMPFNGQYSSVEISGGQCHIYIEKTTGNV